MKILMLSRDPKIFEDDSEVRRRMLEYAKSVDELHIVVFSKGLTVENSKTIGNLFLYPAKSLADMYRIGRKITAPFITAQDPFETGFIGYLLKRKSGASLELQAHTDFLSLYFSSESLKNKIRVIIAKFLIPKADHLRVVSERIKESILRSLRAKRSNLPAIEVRPVAVDLEKIKNSPIRRDLRKKYLNFDFIILMASRFTKEKNIPLALLAMKEIIKNYPKTLLLMVGEGPERKNIESKIKSYELSNNVVIEPWTEDLASYYKTADLFLLTSNYEGYGRTVVEAQAAGAPILMTDVGVAIGETFPVGNLEILTKKLSNIVSKKQK